jgi:replicative DNA helicase
MININTYILLYLLFKDNYNIYRKYINNKDNKELNNLYKYLDALYEKHQDRTSFTVLEFVTFVKSQTSDEILDMLCQQLLEADIGEDVLHDLVVESKHRAEAMEIALLAIDVSEGKKKYDDLLTKVNQNGTIDVQEEIKFVTDDLDELYEHCVKKQGLRWRLKTLNEMLGSLRQGDFGFLFARPESGKTTFLASEVSHFATQTTQPILWFNMEEQGEKVKLRVFQAALGVKLPELFSDREGNRQKYSELVGDRVKIFDNANLHKREVERVCEIVKPGLIIFDQIDKVKGFDADREDLRLGTIYQWARELAKTYSPVIGVTQADGTGEGKKRLTMENVANAKTSKQAEADWILGIGKASDPGLEYVRTLHLSKNKLTGDEDTVPVLRHGSRDVLINAEIARYEDI